MFTDRFIKVPIKLYNREQQETFGTSIEIDSYEMISPFFIASYRPSTDPEGYVHVSFKDGTGLMVYLSVTEFENRLNNHTMYKI